MGNWPQQAPQCTPNVTSRISIRLTFYTYFHVTEKGSFARKVISNRDLVINHDKCSRLLRVKTWTKMCSSTVSNTCSYNRSQLRLSTNFWRSRAEPLRWSRTLAAAQWTRSTSCIPHKKFPWYNLLHLPPHPLPPYLFASDSPTYLFIYLFIFMLYRTQDER